MKSTTSRSMRRGLREIIFSEAPGGAGSTKRREKEEGKRRKRHLKSFPNLNGSRKGKGGENVPLPHSFFLSDQKGK